MKTSLVSLLGGICLACTIAAAEPDATPSSSPAASTASAAPDASPAIHHRRHHILPAPSPTPSATPAVARKRRWWQHAPAPGKAPSATPKPSAPPEPTVQVEPSPVPHHVSTEAAAPGPSATPIHKKSSSGGNWFSSLFKPHHRTKLVRVPSPSPTPVTHKHHKAATAEASPAPGVEATHAPEATAPAPESTPKPKLGGMSEQVPFVPPAEKPEAPAPSESSQAPMVETRTPAEEEAEESSHFQDAKTKAMADPHILDLQSKADSATGDDAVAASKRYYRALYEKMRDIDPGIKDRIDRTEASTLRRVEQENTQ